MLTPESFESWLRVDGTAPVVWRHDTTGFMDKYVGSLCAGGFNPVITDMVNLLNINDPYNCPSAFIPVLCSCYSLDYYPDIPDVYYRKILSYMAELRARKGTVNCVHFLCRVLTGMEVVLDEENTDEEVLDICLKAATLADVTSMDMSVKVIETFISDFIPYYIHTVIVRSEVNAVEMTPSLYKGTVFAVRNHTTLPTPVAV